LPNAFAISSVPRSAPSLRLLTPLIEPDVRVSRIRLSDRSHAAATPVGASCVLGEDRSNPGDGEFASVIRIEHLPSLRDERLKNEANRRDRQTKRLKRISAEISGPRP